MPLWAHLELVLGAPFPGVHEGGKVVFQLRIRGQDGKQIRIRFVEQFHRVRKGTINAVFVNFLIPDNCGKQNDG